MTEEWLHTLKERTSADVISHHECPWLAGQKMSISHQDNGSLLHFSSRSERRQLTGCTALASVICRFIMQPPAGIDLARPQIIGLPDSRGVNMPKNNIWMWATVLICLLWKICRLIAELLPAEGAAWRLSVPRTINTTSKPDNGGGSPCLYGSRRESNLLFYLRINFLYLLKKAL